ncbi:DUF3343 domain-containing protein [Halanaerobium hydrogeniformans]|uniref:DUF3343 domain-containing protein n=1 Tax=Halanaerobium hydrogeniformans TaxID=656519 RepID=UPI00135B1E1E|nr:DUF3343 domain-containing protein [Halanaerobium hydrogeniformans]
MRKNNNSYYVIIFQSKEDSIKAEKILKENEIEYKIIPLPDVIEADCGRTIKIEKNLKEVLDIIIKYNIIYKEMYRVELKDNDIEFYKI